MNPSGMPKYDPKTINEVGNRHHKLTVIEYVGLSKHRHALWLCKCDCGNETVASGNALRTNHTKSCGCLYKFPPGQAAFNALFLLKKHCAKTRGYEFKLSKNQFKQLIDESCFYCGAPPSNIGTCSSLNGNYIYSGIDRMDNNKGYLTNNVVPCCKVCNNAKNTMNISEFFDWIDRIRKRRKQRDKG